MDFVMSLLVLLVLAFVCSGIAASKNRSSLAWFFIGVFFPISSLLLILFLGDPEENKRIATQNRILKQMLYKEQMKNKAFQKLKKSTLSLG